MTSCLPLLLVGSLLLPFAGGCGSTSADSAPDARALVDDAASVDAGDDTVDIFATFGTIETIAGTALIKGKGENGWHSSFEGGLGTSAELSRPHIAVGDAAGNVFIADKDAHAIRKLSPEGIITTVAGTNVAGDDGDGPGLATQMRLSSPNGLWLGSAGSFYIYDLGNDKVRKVDGSGQMTTLFSVAGAVTGRGLWVAPDESRAYVAAGSVLKVWTPGDGVRTLASGFASLANLIVLDNGEIVICDRAANRVYRVGTDGQTSVLAGNGGTSGGGNGMLATATGLHEVRGVWAHPAGGFFVATHKGGQVWYIDTAGYIHLFVNGTRGSAHSGDGLLFDDPAVKIAEPRAVTMDPLGNLLITEHDGGYIRRVNRR